jgi:hypothetical protein
MLIADSPWKEACEKKLPLVFWLLYSRVHEALDNPMGLFVVAHLIALSTRKAPKRSSRGSCGCSATCVSGRWTRRTPGSG